MGLSISREAERLASLANGMNIGTIREQSARRRGGCGPRQ